MRYERAVQEAFYCGEIIDNGDSLTSYGIEMTPGIDASLRGMWRGRNRADNETAESERDAVRRAKEKAANKERYSGAD